MKAKQWGFPYGDVLAYVDMSPGHARNKFIVIGDELNHVAYIPAIHPEAQEIAFLVKAAPNLLAALEAVVDAYGCECLEPTGHCPMCQGRAAVSKATGS